MLTNIKCATCGVVGPFRSDRRQICLHCGADYGRMVSTPVHLPVTDWPDEWEINLNWLIQLIEDAALEC